MLQHRPRRAPLAPTASPSTTPTTTRPPRVLPPPWPCCSGTLPQLAADYGINTYLLGPARRPLRLGNLYLPLSSAGPRATRSSPSPRTIPFPKPTPSASASKRSRPCTFTLHLRIPEWTGDPQLLVNGQPQTLEPRERLRPGQPPMARWRPRRAPPPQAPPSRAPPHGRRHTSPRDRLPPLRPARSHAARLHARPHPRPAPLRRTDR